MVVNFCYFVVAGDGGGGGSDGGSGAGVRGVCVFVDRICLILTLS